MVFSEFMANDDYNDPDALVAGHGTYEIIAAWHLISFRVQVPKKNQPVRGPLLDVASEEYLARWNGSILMVFWEQARESAVPFYGGQVVRDLLREAIKAAGLNCEIVGPTFAHTDLRIVAESGGRQRFSHRARWEVGLSLPVAWDPDTLADVAMLLCQGPAAQFYRLAATNTRIRVTDNVLRNDLVALLQIQHDRSAIPVVPLWVWIAYRWRMRGWRRGARALMSRMWLASAQIEALRSQWEEDQADLNDSISETDGVNLFDVDNTGHQREVAGVDLRFPQEALAYVASRLDNRDVVIATALGALAGAIAGAIAGHFVASPP